MLIVFQILTLNLILILILFLTLIFNLILILILIPILIFILILILTLIIIPRLIIICFYSIRSLSLNDPLPVYMADFTSQLNFLLFSPFWNLHISDTYTLDEMRLRWKRFIPVQVKPCTQAVLHCNLLNTFVF